MDHLCIIDDRSEGYIEMAARKRVALLLGQADENYQERFIKGFLEQAFKQDLDVCVFSMYIKYQDTNAREIGDSNIFNLVNYSLFDAVVVLLDTIQTPGVADALEDEIKRRFAGPVLVVDLESKYFNTIWTDSYTPVRKLIDHLIEEHGYRDIAFLTGKKWHAHSKMRLKAYRDSMEAHSLPVREDRIAYGDYWYTSGGAYAEELLKKPEDMPQAIACANDQMAIGICQVFAQCGIAVPDDIAVIGFDSVEEGRLSPVPITSAYIPAASTGRHAAKSIMRLIDGEAISDPETEVEIFKGESCGCAADHMAYQLNLRTKWETELSEDGFFSLHNTMQEDMLKQSDLRGALECIYEHLYQIKGFESFHICLSEQWMTPRYLTEGRLTNHGYTDRMLKALTAYGEDMEDTKEGKISLQEGFDTCDLLPEMFEGHKGPRAYIFTPLYFEASCLGYAVVNYGNKPRSYDELYRLWIMAVMRGLESVRRAILVRENFHKEKKDSYEQLQKMTQEEEDCMNEVASILDENRLNYFYQPIVSAVDGSIYAFEALMRARSEMKISPLQIIKYAAQLKRLADVEKATFLNVLGQMEANEKAFEGRHIFINSIPGTKLEEKDYIRIEEMLSKRGEQAVVELTEQAEMNDEELDRMKGRFARLGIGTAVDDYGTGYSNVSNLLRYMPNYVKVDRSLLSGIQDSPQKQHFVREVVTFSHDNGIKVLAEGVETSEELRTVIALGCDLIQGYYTGRPNPVVLESIDERIIEEIKHYHKERLEGGGRRVYETGKTGRFSASALTKEGYNYLVTKGGEATYRDYVLSGTPGQRADIKLEIKSGYEGQITLEHVYLGSPRHTPIIDIEPGAKLTILLAGENILNGGGINVPAGASLTLIGDGDLNIQVRDSEFCGVGCATGDAGRIEFYQTGAVIMDAFGAKGVGIGGMGKADILITQGRYVMQFNGDKAVGIGSFDDDSKCEIHDCELDLTFSCKEAVGIGSFNENSHTDIWNLFLHCFGSGKAMAALGTINGNRAKISVKEIGSNIDLRAERATAAGALFGFSDVEFNNMSFHYTGNGVEAYAYGGLIGEGRFKADNCDLTVRLRNEAGRVSTYPGKVTDISSECRIDYTVNGNIIGTGENET